MVVFDEEDDLVNHKRRSDGQCIKVYAQTEKPLFVAFKFVLGDVQWIKAAVKVAAVDALEQPQRNEVDKQKKVVDELKANLDREQKILDELLAKNDQEA